MQPPNPYAPSPQGYAPGQPAPGYPAPGYPPAGAAAAPPKKKSRVWGCLAMGCGALLLAMLGLCGIGGYLAYLEEGVEFGEPGEEIVSAPFMPGGPAAISYTWDGTGYAHHHLWLEITGRTAGGRFRIQGTSTCEYPRDLSAGLDEPWSARRVEQRPDGTFTAWFNANDAYDHSSPSPRSCSGQFTAAEGEITSGRIVITRIQRPSDWLAGM
jgi:hypothetical protein